MTHSFARRERSLAILVLATLVAGLLSFLVVAGPAQATHPTNAQLQVTPEVSEPAHVGSDPAGTNPNVGATLTGRMLDRQSSQPVNAGNVLGVRIRFRVESGPGALNAASCTIPQGSSSCTVKATSLLAGTTLVRAWIDHDQADFPVGTDEFDPDEGRLASQNSFPAPSADCRNEISDEAFPTVCFGFPPAAATPGAVAEPDNTDVVEIRFSDSPTIVDCDDSNASNQGSEREVNPVGQNESYSCTVTDPSGGAISGARIDGENIGSSESAPTNGNGANDPDDDGDGSGPDYDTTNTGDPVTSTTTCVTDANGKCTVTISAAESQSGNAIICFWLDSDAGGSGDKTYAPGADPGGSVSDGGQCDEEDVDESEGTRGTGNDATDVVLVRWEPGPRTATTVDVEPETQSKTTGETAAISATVRDQFGDALANAQPKFEKMAGSTSDADGNGFTLPDMTCPPTDSSGKCSVSYSSGLGGTDRICGWVGATPTFTAAGSCGGENTADGSSANAVDIVLVTWSAPSSGGGGGGGGGGTTTETAQGYALVGTDGGIFNYGTAEFHGSTGDIKLNKPVVGMAYLPGGDGYWMVASDGGIFTFGKAAFHGSMADSPLNAPIIGMEATPDGKGYWLFASDGGIFSFGNAEFFGSMGDQKLNQPVVNMAANPSGKGYWLVALDGGTFSFGAAPFHGSMGDQRLNQPIFDLAPTSDAGGYWLVARDGGIFSFGNASSQFFGSAVGLTSNQVIGMGPTPTYKGYWIADNKGAVFPFGDAKFLGDMRNTQLNGPIIAFTTIRKK